MQRPAKPFRPVRLRLAPPGSKEKALTCQGFFFVRGVVAASSISFANPQARCLHRTSARQERAPWRYFFGEPGLSEENAFRAQSEICFLLRVSTSTSDFLSSTEPDKVLRFVGCARPWSDVKDPADFMSNLSCDHRISMSR
jgi:hypothetical protein